MTLTLPPVWKYLRVVGSSAVLGTLCAGLSAVIVEAGYSFTRFGSSTFPEHLMMGFSMGALIFILSFLPNFFLLTGLYFLGLLQKIPSSSTLWFWLFGIFHGYLVCALASLIFIGSSESTLQGIFFAFLWPFFIELTFPSIPVAALVGGLSSVWFLKVLSEGRR